MTPNLPRRQSGPDVHLRHARLQCHSLRGRSRHPEPNPSPNLKRRHASPGDHSRPDCFSRKWRTNSGSCFPRLDTVSITT